MILTGGNQRTLRNTCAIAALSTTNSTYTDSGANRDLRGREPATNRLSRGTASNALKHVATTSDDRKRSGCTSLFRLGL
jgi:hypothetical protein